MTVHPEEYPMYPPPTIPNDWPPEQALAVYDFLDNLCDGIAECYRRDIAAARRQRDELLKEEQQLALPLEPLDDNMPF
jgi:hypothetical protein